MTEALGQPSSRGTVGSYRRLRKTVIQGEGRSKKMLQDSPENPEAP